MRERLRESLRYVGQALHEPEDFAVRWQRQESVYPWWVFAALVATAAAGTTTYGLTMGMLGGVERMLHGAVSFSVAALIAWGLPLPALYILNSLTGSRLTAGATFLAALVTISWGGLALIASIPINLFFTASLPYRGVVLAINLIVFTGVGVCMIDVFGRVMARLEPERGRAPALWLALVAALGAELFYSFGLFDFSLPAG